MAWDQKVIPDTFLSAALAAVADAANGTKDATYMAFIQNGIGTSWKRQFLRDDVVVFEGTGTGLIPYTGRTFSIPAVTKTSITSADIDTGEWIHRVINASDSTKYMATKVTPTGGAGPGILTGDLVSPNDVVWSTFVLNGPRFDSTSQSWLDLIYRGMTLQGDLFDQFIVPGGASVAMNGRAASRFGSSYAKGVSSAGVAASMIAGTGSNAFSNGMNSMPAWGWMYAGFGNTDTNAGLEYRRMFGQVRRKSTGQWQMLYQGGRAQGSQWQNEDGDGSYGNQIRNYTANSSYCKPIDGLGYEVWVEPSETNPEINSFHGKIDNVALTDFDCVCVGFQVRIVDRTPGLRPVFLANIGWDFFRVGVNPRYDSAGYPFGAYDGGGRRWELLPENGDWAWIVAIGVGELARSDGIPPPWGNYEEGWVWNNPPLYGLTWAQVQANPPIDVPALYPPDVVTPVFKIEAVGDSLTQGNDEASPSSYRTWRGTFQSFMAGAGIAFDMIGPRAGIPLSGGGDPQHAAWGGMGISSVDDATNNATSRNSTIFAAEYQPDIVIIYLGWNALFNGGSQATTANTRFETYYDLVRSTRPSAKIVLCTLSPTSLKTEAEENAATTGYSAFNSKVRALASANPSTTIVAELAQIPYVAEDWFDYIHKTQSGASKEAQVIFAAVRAKGWF
jgi:lysophospholipase L1-like esterase